MQGRKLFRCRPTTNGRPASAVAGQPGGGGGRRGRRRGGAAARPPAAPPSLDLRRGARGEREHRVGCWNEHVELRVMQLARGVVRVAQVMDGLDEWTPRRAEDVDDVLHVAGRSGVEAEVHVVDVEVVGARREPVGLERRWRPPGVLRVAQPEHRVDVVLVGQRSEVTDVHMVGGHGQHDPRRGCLNEMSRYRQLKRHVASSGIHSLPEERRAARRWRPDAGVPDEADGDAHARVDTPGRSPACLPAWC